MDPNDHFVAFQTAILARLTEVDANVPAPVPANGQPVPFISELLHDVETELQTSLAKYGMGIVVRTPLGKLIDPQPRSRTLVMDAPIMIEVNEDVILNQTPGTGTQIPALRMVVFLMKRLQGYPIRIYEGAPDTQRAWLDLIPFILIPDQVRTVYAVAAHGIINLNAPLAA